MPNHVTNIIEIKGDPARIKSLFEAVKNDEYGLGSIDFSKLIPMPPELDIEEGSKTSRGLKAYKDFIEVYTFNGQKENFDLLNIPEKSEQAFLRVRPDIDRTAWDLGRQAFQNEQKYGTATWYKWRIRNWGTKWNAYGYSSGKKSFASQPCDLRRLFSLIQQLESRLANVVVENQDFETLIHHYDRPDTFFYLDPPYFSTEDMYAVEFAWADHVRLRDTAANMQGRFLLSYNDCLEIRELYAGFPVFDLTRVHSMAQRYEAGKEFKELLIGNYDLSERENAKPAQMKFEI